MPCHAPGFSWFSSIFFSRLPQAETSHKVLVHLAISLTPRSPRLVSLRLMQQTLTLRSHASYATFICLLPRAHSRAMWPPSRRRGRHGDRIVERIIFMIVSTSTAPNLSLRGYVSNRTFGDKALRAGLDCTEPWLVASSRPCDHLVLSHLVPCRRAAFRDRCGPPYPSISFQFSFRCEG